MVAFGRQVKIGQNNTYGMSYVLCLVWCIFEVEQTGHKAKKLYILILLKRRTKENETEQAVLFCYVHMLNASYIKPILLFEK